jgi:hypothetical protein
MEFLPFQVLIRLKEIVRYTTTLPSFGALTHFPQFLRITLTRTTLAFFLLSFFLCFAQSLIQSFLFTIDADASALFSSTLDAARVPYRHQFAWNERSHDPAVNGGVRFHLRLCNHLPNGRGEGNCTTVYDSAANTGVNATSTIALVRRDAMFEQPVAHFADNGALDGVTLSMQGTDDSLFLSERCAQTLVYPDQIFKNAKREELALIGSQFWLFSISVYAVSHRSGKPVPVFFSHHLVGPIRVNPAYVSQTSCICCRPFESHADRF